MRLETLKTSGSAGLGAAASKVVGWHRLGPGAVCVAPGPLLCPKSVGEAQASKLLKRDKQKRTGFPVLFCLCPRRPLTGSNAPL